MAVTLLEFQTRLFLDGITYRARACGRQQGEGTWEGWLEFVPHDGGPVIASARETTQPNLTDIRYWATGLTPVYLEGALERSLKRTPRQAATPPEPPTYDGPAGPSASMETRADANDVLEPVLDPFSVYAKGEQLLRQRLRALSAWHLRTIVRAYELAAAEVDVEELDDTELIALIVTATRARAAA
jgi:hypothetical protein